MRARSIRWAGLSAALIECHDLDDMRSLHGELLRRQVRASDLIPAATTVLVDGLIDAADLDWCPGWVAPHDAIAAPGPLVEVPTTYDGADLAHVARQWQMTVAEVVATHQSLTFTVAFCGFAPGFSYCTGLPEPLWLPRLRDPRPHVRAGSVAIADRFTAVYPTSSPGGWLLLGHTELPMWQADQDPPATLAPHTQVRFVDA